jgi:Resolvase, N terminal domain
VRAHSGAPRVLWFSVVARFSDAAIRGGTVERSGYKSLLQAARQHQVEVIVAEDTSRLWRLLAEQAPRLAELAVDDVPGLCRAQTWCAVIVPW